MQADVAIIGAGIVGLATALAISRNAPDSRIVVLEKEPEVATHQSGNNSGVIHSGIYYRPGTLKSQLCTTGAAEMLTFVSENDIPHQCCGKVIVANKRDELPFLSELFARGSAIGVEGLRRVGPDELKEIEPLAVGIEALHLPRVAVTDYRLVCLKIAEQLRQHGVTILTSARVAAIRSSGSSIRVASRKLEVDARRVINCAGLHSDRVACAAGLKPPVRIVPFRGEYFQVSSEAAAMVRGLIYPVPNPAMPFLGVHLTRSVDGRVLAGPNAVLALSREGYRRSSVQISDLVGLATSRSVWRMAARNWRIGIDELHRSLSAREFVKSVRRLTPSLEVKDFRRNGSGVRAQAIESDGSFVDDFRFLSDGPVLHVLNVPSPAATAAFAVARVIAEKSAQ